MILVTVEIFAGEGSFCSMRAISQPRGDFAGGFTGPFAAAKWGCGAAKWHMCAQGVFHSCEMIS